MILPDAAGRLCCVGDQGEITLLIGGRSPVSGSGPPDEAHLRATLERLLHAGESASSAAKLAAAECGVAKKAVYDLAVQLAAEQGQQTDRAIKD
jgi:16S rRNA C1402 (ribose-2'-O) methylase RsmI